MKKVLIAFLIIVCVLTLIFYFALGRILDVASRVAIRYLIAEIEPRGIQIDQAGFGSVSVHLPNGATWKKLHLSGKVALRDLPLSGRSFDFKLNELTIGLDNFAERIFFIKAKGLDALLKERPEENSTEIPPGGDHLIGDYLATKFKFDFTHPNEALPMAAALAQDLLGLLLNGRCSTFVEFSGAMNFTMNDKAVQTDFQVERRGNESVLILDPESLEKLSSELKERLNQIEISLLSENSLKAPQLLRISLHAQHAAEKAHEKNPAVSEDAYRHVLWSYLLTKEFGPEFAAQATDAHERGDREESDGERRMDTNNNMIGREYAQKGYHELQVVELVLEDSRIIRSLS